MQIHNNSNNALWVWMRNENESSDSETPIFAHKQNAKMQ